MIATLQTSLQTLTATAQGVDFSNIANGGAAFGTLADGVRAASDAHVAYSDATQKSAAATAEATGATAQAEQVTSALAGATAQATEATSQGAAATTAASGALQEHNTHANNTTVSYRSLAGAVHELSGGALPQLSSAVTVGSELINNHREAMEEDKNTVGQWGVGLVAAGLAVAAISFESFDSDVEKVHQLALQSGMTSEAVVGLQTSMEAVGVSGDRMQTMIMMSSRSLESMQMQVDAGKEPTGKFADALKTLGVNAFDSSGNVRSFGDLMPEIADAFKAASDHAAETGTTFHAAGVAADLFGRSGAQLVPMLLEGSAGMVEYTKRAAELGIGSDAEVAHLEQWKKTQADLHLEVRGFTDMLGSSVEPALNAVVGTVQPVIVGLNGLSAPLKELIIAAPLAVGGLLLVVTALATMAGAVAPVIAGLAALSVALVTTPAGLLLLALAGLSVALVELKLHLSDGGKEQNAYATAVSTANDSINKQVQAFAAAGAGADQMKNHISVAYQGAVDNYNAANSAVEAYLQKVTAEAHGQEVDTASLAKHDETFKTLLSTQSTAQATAQGWFEQLQKQDGAIKDNAAATSELNTQATKFAATLDQTGVAQQAVATYTTQADDIAKKAVATTAERTATEAALADAVKIVAMSDDARAQAETGLDNQVKNGTDSQKAYAALVKELIPVLGTVSAAQIEAKIDQEAVNKALSDMKQPGHDAQDVINQVTQAFKDGKISANDYEQALVDAFTKPTSQELQLRQQMDANKIVLSQWAATLANSSAIDQHIASLQKQLDQEQRTGASTEQLTKTHNDLNLQLAAVSSSEGDAIVAGQKRSDAIEIEQGALGAERTVLQDTRTASHDAAEMAGTHALSITDVTNAVNPLTAAIPALTDHTHKLAGANDEAQKAAALLAGNSKDASTGVAASGNSASTAATQMDTYTSAVNRAVSALKLFNANTPIIGNATGTPSGNISFPGTGALATGAGTSGQTPQDIMEWAKANAAALNTTADKLATIELTLSNYESGYGANPFQFMGDLATTYGQNGTAGQQLDALVKEGRVQQAIAAWDAAGGGLAGAHAAESAQERPGEEGQYGIIARGGDQSFAGSLADATGRVGNLTVASPADPLPVQITNPVPATNGVGGFGTTGNPVEPYHAGVGNMHEGTDLSAPEGSAVLAAIAGRVVGLGSPTAQMGDPGLGRYVAIQGADGIVTIYGHNEHQDVQMGQQVGAGQQIAEVGSTGMSSGPHVHFQVQTATGELLNSDDFLQGKITPTGMQAAGVGALQAQQQVSANGTAGSSLAGVTGAAGQNPVPAPPTLNADGLTTQQQQAWQAAHEAQAKLVTLANDTAKGQDEYNLALKPLAEKTAVTAESLQAETAARGPLIDSMTSAYTNYQTAAANMKQLLASGTATPNQMAEAQTALDNAKGTFESAKTAVSDANKSIAADTKEWHKTQVDAVNALATGLTTAYKNMYADQLSITKDEIAKEQQADEDRVTALKKSYDQQKQLADQGIANQEQQASRGLQIAQRAQNDQEQVAFQGQQKALQMQQQAENDALNAQDQAAQRSLQHAQQAQSDALNIANQKQTDALNAATKSQVDAINTRVAGEVATIYQATGQTVSAQMAQESSAAAGVRQQQEADLASKAAAATGTNQTSLQNQLASMRAEDVQAAGQAEIQKVQDAAKLQQQALQDQQKVQQQALQAQQQAQNDALSAASKQRQETLKHEQDQETAALQASQKTQTEALQDAESTQATNLKNNYAAEKLASDTYYDNLKTDADNWLIGRKRTYTDELAEAQKYYNQHTTAAYLNAKVQQDIENGSQAKIVDMLATYNPDWNEAGKNLGESLISGLNKSDIPGAVDAIMKTAGIATETGTAGGVSAGLVGAKAGGIGAPIVNFNKDAINITVGSGADTGAGSDIESAVRRGVAEGIADGLGRGATLAGAGNP